MELRGREQHRWVKPRRSNGAYGKSDIDGKTAMEAASKLGKELVSNARQPMSQSAGSERVSIEGTDFRDRRQSCEVAATEYGQRRSFNGANGMSDIEGKVMRVGASERGQRTSFKIGCCNFCNGLFLKAGWRCVDCNADTNIKYQNIILCPI